MPTSGTSEIQYKYNVVPVSPMRYGGKSPLEANGVVIATIAFLLSLESLELATECVFLCSLCTCDYEIRAMSC